MHRMAVTQVLVWCSRDTRRAVQGVPSLPEETASLLVTDIESSIRLLQAFGDEYADVFFLAFPSARAALDARRRIGGLGRARCG
jgi:hypothetical protein